MCHINGFRVVGLTVRSNNAFEATLETSKIFPVVRRFVSEDIASKIQGRVNPGTLICGYTEYESDYTGDYTYFIGEIVANNSHEAPEGLTAIEIPSQRYVKFTNGPGSMPQVLKEPWEQIWSMTPDELGGERTYAVDYEVYDERAKDHSAIVLDILVGLQ